eukprot:CAMPEP_0172574812 /NCGR_PEP_ID=MMETSP1067-20121228/136891_1 /TAXON_ID=265564 ORGANISM="Thalassiosira punctigera, Strain Tpunct2005C2" /NCGR_SAMPLE_ID=MMETSP1067 /ASSEMBLY_ACC=CAM_ASM_000444 /LENGTH=682 /DNA_ID=CAMNT_0013367447 /DNA_START=617 /DNA_END=2668 /DNA_ORIENTATION=-
MAMDGENEYEEVAFPPSAAVVGHPSENHCASSLDLDGGTDSLDDDDIMDEDRGRPRLHPVAPRTMPRKSSLRSRWLVLALTCTVMTGSYYAYDIPSALHQQLQDYMPPSPRYEMRFNLLYTVYSVPNVVLPLFGGNVVDRIGAPVCLAAFASTVCAGAAILSMGVANKSWEVMYLGRFVFGLGAESLCVAQSTVVSDWFEGGEVALAMGIGLAVSRLGSIWNNIVSPKAANNGGGVEAAFWIGATLTFCSVLTAGAVILVDGRATRKLERRAAGGGAALQSLTAALLESEEGPLGPDGDGMAGPRLGDGGGGNPNVGGEDAAAFDENGASAKAACAAAAESGVRITDVRKFTPLFWLLTLSCFVVYGCVLPFNNVASGILLERNFFTSPPAHCHLEYPGQCSVGYLQQGTNDALDENDDVCLIAPSQAPVLPSLVNHTSADSEKSGKWEESTYVYPSLTSDHVDCGDPFWLDACTSDYCGKQNAATEHAGKVMSIPYLISAVSSPLLGHLVDRVGRRAQIAVLSSSLLLVVHSTLAMSSSSPVPPLVGQGIAYSLYAAVLWPSVPLTVPKLYTGTAFGVITSIQNIGLALFPLVIAAVYNASGRRYIPNVEFFFMVCAAAGVVVGVFMNRLDRRYGNKLNKASAEEEDVVVDSIREEGDDDFSAVEGDGYYSPLLHSEQHIT